MVEEEARRTSSPSLYYLLPVAPALPRVRGKAFRLVSSVRIAFVSLCLD